MKIQIGTKYITHYKDKIPCDCSKKCPICHLWYSGWRVRLWKLGFIKFLVWSQDGFNKSNKLK